MRLSCINKSCDNQKCSSIAIGFGLLSVCVIILLLTSFLFLLGCNISNWIFPVSLLLASLPILYISKKDNSSYWRNCLLFYSIILVSLALSSIAYDPTGDGLTYHQDIIYQLKNGWNPVYAHHATGAHPVLAIWVSHYPKGIETISAVIYAFTNNIECGKTVNFMLVIASFCFILHYFSNVWAGLKATKRFYYIFILTLCPIVVAQGLTYYVDWSQYALLAILVLTLLSMNNKIELYEKITIGIVVALAVSIKLNHAFWVGFTILCYLLYVVLRKKYSIACSITLVSVMGVLVGCCVIGYNPYITNFIDHSNPLYSMLGEKGVIINNIPKSIPSNMVDNSAVENVFVSLFSHTIPPMLGTTPVKLYFPLTFTKYDLLACGTADLRVSGYGLFFNVILILSLIFYGLCRLTRKDRLISLMILSGLVVALFILPFGWWARYVPFFYVFPFVILLYSERYQLPVYLMKLRKVIYAFTVINILLVMASALLISISKYKQVEGLLDKLSDKKELKINTGKNVGFKIKLEEAGINYIDTKDTVGLSFRCNHPPVFINLPKE